MIDIKKIKEDFPIFGEHSDLVYLDSSSTSQTPQAVLDAMNEYYGTYRANTRRGQYAISTRADQAYENARGAVARYIGAEPEEIIFTSGATSSFNMLLGMLERSGYFAKGGEIVTTVMEHHSVLLPLQEISRRRGLVLRYIHMNQNFELDYEEARRMIGGRTRLVVFSAASNVTGTIHETQKISALAKNAGARAIIDATQAVGHMSVERAAARETDFLFFSGHKMLGPTGTGVLYGGRDLLEGLEPGVLGGGMVDDVSLGEAKLAPSPWRFEAGTPNIAGVIGLGAACEYLERIGMENIEAHVRGLTRLTMEKLRKIPGVELYCDEDPKKNAGVVSFAVPGIHPHDVAEILSRGNIAVRAGHHCALPLVKEMRVPALVRASVYLYNTEDDIGRLAAGVEKACQLFEKG